LFTDNSADFTGGAIDAEGCDLTIRATQFASNHVCTAGGAIFSLASFVHLEGCAFTDNRACVSNRGGAVGVEQAVLRVMACTFTNNRAGSAGAIWSMESSLTISDSTFRSNRADFGGSGLAWIGGELQVTHSLFDGHMSTMALYSQGHAIVTLEDSAFRQNPGGVWILDNSAGVVVRKCEFVLNAGPSEGGGLLVESSADVTVESCVFQGNSSSTFAGGGLFLVCDGTATIADSTFTGNLSSGPSGGGAMVIGGSGEIRVSDTEIDNNFAFFGGGIRILGGGFPTISGCRITRNGNWGVHVRGGGNVTIINTLLDENTAGTVRLGNEFGGGPPATATIVNSTVTNSPLSSPANQAALFADPSSGSSVVVRNSIIWGSGSGLESDQIMGSADVSHSIIQGLLPGSPYAGPGVIGDDPLFADDDGRLSRGSPAIDAGSNDFVPKDVTTDLDGNPRFVDGTGDGFAIVDMGAFEFQGPPAPGIPGDLNGDGFVDHLDLIILLEAWGPCPAAAMSAPPVDPPPAEPGANGRGGSCVGDLNGDGVVDVFDLLILLGNWD
jgi:parallel beta-helix repeat protein/predicted outer membrane repeat protein